MHVFISCKVCGGEKEGGGGDINRDRAGALAARDEGENT